MHWLIVLKHIRLEFKQINLGTVSYLLTVDVLLELTDIFNSYSFIFIHSYITYFEMQWQYTENKLKQFSQLQRKH